MTKAIVGIIGGSGIYDLDALTRVREERVATRGASRQTRCGSVGFGSTDAVFLAGMGAGIVSRRRASTIAPTSTRQAGRRHRHRFAFGLRLLPA